VAPTASRGGEFSVRLSFPNRNQQRRLESFFQNDQYACRGGE
jgi:hypothetical protein